MEFYRMRKFHSVQKLWTLKKSSFDLKFDFFIFIFQRYFGTSVNTFLGFQLFSNVVYVLFRTNPRDNFFIFLNFEFFILFSDLEIYGLDLEKFCRAKFRYISKHLSECPIVLKFCVHVY